MTFSQVRESWLNFFKSKNHLIIESQSLIPKNDNSLLWINSGVATLKKYFSGVETPPSFRLTNSQRCIRTNDISNVGVTSRHHTFFEMLGNFSIGDYFRKEAIEMAFEYLTKILEFDIKKLYFTVFEDDKESYDLWIKLGVIKSHIIKCKKDRNFWEIGQGPCGPCTEIYYDRGEKYDFNKVGERLFFEDIENDRYIEIWNIVFSEFENDGKNNYTPLARKNIDTGAGLERLACVMQDVNTNYDTDVFVYVRNIMEKYTEYKYDTNLYFEKNKDSIKILINKAFSVIIDHFKSCIFAISDGAIPSNKDRGYIIRKLLRVSFINMDILRLKDSSINFIIDAIIDTMKDFYPYLLKEKTKLYEVFKNEYQVHHNSLSKSIKQFIELTNNEKIDEKQLFTLVDTYGFPLEIIKELEIHKDINAVNFILEAILNKFNYKMKPIKKLELDFDLFNQFFEEHREISKSSNNNVSGLDKQTKNLINLNVVSKFDYNSFDIKQSKVVKIFDQDFNIVEEIKNSPGYIVLDNTCFYATSGGQVNDVGVIKNSLIDNVIKSPNGQHIHHFECGTFTLGELVDGKIDVNRRNILSAHHSTEHLLHSALKRKIDNSIKQEGALKSPEKVTFDFHYHKKLDIDSIKLLENDIKEIINKNQNSELFEVTLEEAQKLGALAYFEEVYKKIKGKLRVIKLGDYSIEICGGTHVKKTSDIEDFKIIKLDSKGSGTWRIEAIATKKLINDFDRTIKKQTLDDIKKFISDYHSIGLKDEEFEKLIDKNFDNMHFIELKQYYDLIKNALNVIKYKFEKTNQENIILNLKNNLKSYNELVNYVKLENIDRKILMQTLTNLVNENRNNIYLIINFIDNNYQYFLCGNDEFIKSKNLNLQQFANLVNSNLNGKGGGRFNFVQGNFNESSIEKIDSLFNKIMGELK